MHAKTSEEIGKEIEQKKAEVEKLNTNIGTLQKDLEAGKAKLAQVSGKKDQLRLEIENVEKERVLVEAKIEDAENQKALSELEKEERIKLQDEFITNAYLNWKETNWIKEVLGADSESIIKIATYQATLASEEKANIERLGVQIVEFENQLEILETQQVEHKSQLEKLANLKQQLEAQLISLDSKLKQNTNDLGNYRSKIGEMQSQIDQLTKEQKEIQEYERKLLKAAKNGGTKELIKGEIYFQGVGRELYQGHGVGFSQFGAVGAALKGWDYKKILELYYPGTKIIKYQERKNITVEGYKEMLIEDYVAGAGEVPDFSCEDIDEKFDNNNVWKCWPEEAIKAQIVAFRTYGIEQTQNGQSICTTARCQVYKAGDNKKWAAEATVNEVIVYEGKPIKALYSSDNHNGWGTADNETVWSNFEGEGTPIEYLRAVNDSAVAFKFAYTDWSWRTNSYTIDEIQAMLQWSSSSNEASSSYKEFLKTLLGKVGKLQNIEFERDKSGRVAKVKLGGNKGSAYIAGWLFKSVWNIYVGNTMPSGEADYIYSLTYFMKQA